MSQPVFDKSAFSRIVNLIAVRVQSKDCHLVTQTLGKNVIFYHPAIKSIVIPDDHSQRLVLLHQDIKLESVPKDKLPQDAALIEYPLQLTYDNISADEILRKILPDNVEVPTGFETIGHVAHLNLRPEHLPFKQIIGQVLLDKNPRLRTIVNKTSSISDKFRVFPLELLAGEPNYVAELKQQNCIFRFDFSQVYWNSRLDTEHERMVNLFKPKELICDMMCGIGPFALPAGKKGNTVLANDLNPKSYEYLCSNITLNKLQSKVKPFNMDGREFWRHVRTMQRSGEVGPVHHVLMNLPAIALEFLDSFCGTYTADEVAALGAENLPMIHCYCFSGAADLEADVVERATAVLGAKPTVCGVSFVRLVSPKKSMMRISFRLPEHSALNVSPLAEYHQTLEHNRAAGDDESEQSNALKRKSTDSNESSEQSKKGKTVEL